MLDIFESADLAGPATRLYLSGNVFGCPVSIYVYADFLESNLQAPVVANTEIVKPERFNPVLKSVISLQWPIVAMHGNLLPVLLCIMHGKCKAVVVRIAFVGFRVA